MNNDFSIKDYDKNDNNNAPTAIDFEWLKDKMTEGIVWFVFKKKDGTIREALGTLANKYLPPSNPSQFLRLTPGEVDALNKGHLPLQEFYYLYCQRNGLELIHDTQNPGYITFKIIKKSRAASPSVFTYYDMQKKGWRRFSKNSFIKVVDAHVNLSWLKFPHRDGFYG